MPFNKEKLTNTEFWAMPAEKVIEFLETSEEGLSESSVKERLEEFGANALPEERRGVKLKILLGQFTNPLIIILIVAGIITLLIQDIKDGVFIFIAVFINAALGFYQENKAANALSKLKTYVKDRVRTIRDGIEKEVDVEEIVPGDVIRLTTGIRIPADARLFISNDLSVDESILTGESLPVSKTTEAIKKSADVIDRESMIYSGTLVVGGIGLAVVTSTGIRTELGKIATLLKERSDEPTPLQKYIKRFSIWAGAVFLFMAVALFALGISLGYTFSEMFLISVAVAVSAVPEGLPIALTVVLAIGVERLAKRKGIVKKLIAAEALGSTTLVLTDKTGTLTEAKMELAEIIGDESHEKILEFALLTVEATVENPKSAPGEWRVMGRPVESAIVRAGVNYKLFLPELISKQEILTKKPFNSTDKYAAVEVKIDSKRHWIYLGAPDILAEMSGLKKSKKEDLLEQLDKLTFSGYRVLGVAMDKDFLGFMAFNDPIRKGVKKAIQAVADAGVKTIIVTGDHKGTALAVAKEVGIEANSEEVMTGAEVRELSDTALKKRMASIHVFARITPADKLRLVKLYQERGEIVAVTGDGVNDAPALEGADIGIAVGSGTDIAKDAADLIILDDNFETIVAAISEGRRIMANIKKILVYLLSDALDELFLIGGALVFGLPLPLNALQILWVNFFSDSFPSVALAFEKEPDGLSLPQSKKDRGLIDNKMKFLIVIIGVTSSAILFTMYYFLLKYGFPEDIVRTFIFASFSVYTLFLAFSVKSLHKSILKYNPFDNPYLIGGVLIGIGLTLVAIYVPYFQELLDTVSLPWPWMLGVIGLGLLNIVGVELGKFIFRKTV